MNWRHFIVCVLAISLIDLSNACDEVFTATHGTISSNLIGSLNSCRWTITPGSLSPNDQVFVDVLHLFVEPEDGTLRIYDGPDNTALLLFESDHMDLPSPSTVDPEFNFPSIRSSNGSLHVEYDARSVGAGVFDLLWNVQQDRQMEAALALRPYFKVDPWDWLDETKPICTQSLPGIECKFNTVVRFSTFGSKNAGDLNGTLPPEIQYFDELSALNLDLITSDLPDSLSTMLHLQTIICDACIMHDFPVWIKDLERLKVFTFRATDGSNDAAVNVMPAYFLSTHVYYFLCTECRLTGSLSAFSSLTNLEVLDLETNRFTGALPELSSQVLIDLDLSENFFTGPIPESYRSLQVQRLELSHNQLTGPFPHNGFPALRAFDVAANNFTGEIPGDWFQPSVQLSDFHLGENPLTCPVRDYSSVASRTDVAWYKDDGSLTCTGGELAVLKEVAAALGSASWSVLWNFSDTHYCHFEGVTCEQEAGEITDLDLTGVGIQGIPPSSIATLGLKSLRLKSDGVFCPLVDYSSWAYDTDYSSANSCFECSISRANLGEHVRATSSDGCSEHDIVGTSCHLECVPGMREFSGSAALTCAGVEGYDMPALQCKPGCSPPELESHSIVASPNCTDASEGSLCELQCADDLVVGASDPSASLAPLKCFRESEGFVYGEMPPQMCTQPCSFIATNELSDRNVEVSEGCLNDKHGDICMLQCAENHDLVEGSLELVCHFKDGKFSYAGTAPKCFQSDKRYGMAVFGVLGMTALVAWCGSCWSGGPNPMTATLVTLLTATHVTCNALFVREVFGLAASGVANVYWVLELAIACLCLPFVANATGLVYYLSRMPEVVDSLKDNVGRALVTLLLSCVNIEFLGLWTSAAQLDDDGDEVALLGWPVLKLLGALPFVSTTLPLVFAQLYLISAGGVHPSTLFYVAVATTIFLLGTGFAKVGSLSRRHEAAKHSMEEHSEEYGADAKAEAVEMRCRSSGFATSDGVGKMGAHRSMSAGNAMNVDAGGKKRVSVPGVHTMRRGRDQRGLYSTPSEQRPPPIGGFAGMGRRLSQAVGRRISGALTKKPVHSRRSSASGQALLNADGRPSISTPDIEDEVKEAASMSPRSPVRASISRRLADAPLSPLSSMRALGAGRMATVEEESASPEIARIMAPFVVHREQSSGHAIKPIARRKSSAFGGSPRTLAALREETAEELPEESASQ